MKGIWLEEGQSRCTPAGTGEKCARLPLPVGPSPLPYSRIFLPPAGHVLQQQDRVAGTARWRISPGPHSEGLCRRVKQDVPSTSGV